MTESENNNQINNTQTELTRDEFAPKKCISNLKDGLLNIYEPDLKKLETQLSELTKKQSILIEQMHNENLKLAWSQNSPDLNELFPKIQLYRDKLINIKRDMQLLHDRSTKLKKRALRLQQFKEKQDLMKEQQRQKELELIGK